jgi:acyl-CoA synthetase
MLGNFGNQAATEDSFNSSGWFMSGDLGRFDSQGNLQVVGRAKDLIIRGGHNIHPARVEELAHRNPAVAKAAVIGVPDERLGERVCLAIIPAVGCTPTAQEVLAHLHSAGLSKFDMPEYFLSLDSMPMTASGKILKRELANWVASGKLAPQCVRWTRAG